MSMIFIEKMAHFRRSKKKRVTDQPTDHPTDGPSDMTSYRDARTHLKRMEQDAEGGQKYDKYRPCSDCGGEERIMEEVDEKDSLTGKRIE